MREVPGLSGPVAGGPVVRDRAVQEVPPTLVRGVLACLGEVGVERLVVGDRHGPFHGRLLPLQGVGVGVGGLAPAVLGPGAAERREHLERVAVVLAHAAGRHGVRGAGAHQLPLVLGQRLRHGLVALRAVGPEVGGDVHGRGVDGLRDLGHHLGGVAAHDEQPPAERRVQRPERPVEVGAAGRARRVEQGGVEHEQGECGLRGVAGGEERRLVAHPQVAAEPDEGRVAHGRRR